MLAALQAFRPNVRPECHTGFVVSTVKAGYARVDRNWRCGGSPYPDGPLLSALLVRSGSRWSVRTEAIEWFCSDRYAPRPVIKDLFRACVPTQQSPDFVTPDGNIACAYRGDQQSVGEVWCYVRSSRTLAVVNESGAGRNAYVKRGVRQPADIARVRGPILSYGEQWKSPFYGIVRCVSRATGLTCINRDTGFVASRDEVRTL